MLRLYDLEVKSRILIGTALYPSPAIMRQSILASGAEVITLSLRRQSPDSDGGREFWNYLRKMGLRLLPNTAGCKTAREAIAIAEMARELFETSLIKLEVIGDDYNLQPDPVALLDATKVLLAEGFQVFPYCTDDLVLCMRLAELGCQVVMPWGSPIGSGQGLLNPYNLRMIRKRLPELTLILDAGIGRPSDAIQAMELGFDGILLNSAVALAQNPEQMATAFALAVEAGRLGYLSGAMPKREFANPSTPTLGTPFWHGMQT